MKSNGVIVTTAMKMASSITIAVKTHAAVLIPYRTCAAIFVMAVAVGSNAPIVVPGIFNMPFIFRPAARESVWLLLGLSGASGSGKTYSGMRLASGLSGDRPFAVIDTEAGRAKHYADRFKFDHGDLAAPFTPEHYLEAIIAAEKAGYGVILVDSMSHEWAGDGGILDMQEAELERMAGNDWDKREKCKMAAWIKPKLSHKRMMQRLLQLRAHLILCFRAEPKIEMVKGKDGRLQIQPKVTLTGLDGWVPICEKSLPFELTASFLLTPDKPGIPHPIKLQEQHKAFFPMDQPIDEQAGKQLGDWARGGAKVPQCDICRIPLVLRPPKKDGEEAFYACPQWAQHKGTVIKVPVSRLA